MHMICGMGARLLLHLSKDSFLQLSSCLGVLTTLCLTTLERRWGGTRHSGPCGTERITCAASAAALAVLGSPPLQGAASIQ